LRLFREWSQTVPSLPWITGVNRIRWKSLNSMEIDKLENVNWIIGSSFDAILIFISCTSNGNVRLIAQHMKTSRIWELTPKALNCFHVNRNKQFPNESKSHAFTLWFDCWNISRVIGHHSHPNPRQRDLSIPLFKIRHILIQKSE
jgi:hypothetical protein